MPLPVCINAFHHTVAERRARRARLRGLERDLAAFTSPNELSELDALMAASASPAADVEEIRAILYRQAVVRLHQPSSMHLFHSV
jgi:hypothetical protein